MIRTLTKLNIFANNTKTIINITPYMDIINTIKTVIETNETHEHKLVENQFTQRKIGASFVHISKTCLETSQEFVEFQEKNPNIDINIKFYPSMFNDKYGVQYFPDKQKIDIYLD
jgi:hypothetical protein